MTAFVITFPKQRRFTPVADVLPVLAPGNLAIEGRRAKIAIVRRFDAKQIRDLAALLHDVADRLEREGDAA